MRMLRRPGSEGGLRAQLKAIHALPNRQTNVAASKMDVDYCGMAKSKRHSKLEIATKLARANDLMAQGKLQSDIARTLRVSVMTLHRWRKVPAEPQPASAAFHQGSQPPHLTDNDADRIAELQVENSRLRRLVTDLLLEKMTLDEAARSHEPSLEGSNSALRK
jgi:putative transposase